MKPESKSLYRYVREAAGEQGSLRFLFNEERSLTFAETASAAVAAANRLHALGVGAGALVALRTTRTIDTAVLMLAVPFLGACAALMDPHDAVKKSAAEKGLSPDYLLSDESGVWKLTDAARQTETTIRPIDGADSQEPLFDPEPDVTAPAFLIFTSGSTAASKGVMLSQYNVMNHIRNYRAAGCYDPDDISIEVLPLEHVFGLAVLLMGLYCRYQIFFPRTVKAPYVAECIERYRITRLDGVPSFALALTAEKQAGGPQMTSLRTAVMGGAPSGRKQFERIERTLGLTIVPVYGLSECIGISGIPKSESAARRASCVGRFLPMCEGAILDEAGEPLPPGREGEICVRAPSVMLGYYNDPAATAAAIDPEGFLHTGDLGYLDDEGYLFISGRKKEIIIRNGRNLSAAQLEEKLLSLPSVQEAAVVGMPHARQGEVPCAAIVLKDGAAPEAALFWKEMETILSKPELPERVLFLDALPYLASGKTDKQKIREVMKS